MLFSFEEFQKFTQSSRGAVNCVSVACSFSQSTKSMYICLQALTDSMSSHKRTAADGESREERLLQESATKEAAMESRLDELQTELKQARVMLANASAENDRLAGLSTQLKKVHTLPSIRRPVFACAFLTTSPMNPLLFI